MQWQMLSRSKVTNILIEIPLANIQTVICVKNWETAGSAYKNICLDKLNYVSLINMLQPSSFYFLTKL